MKVGAFVFDVKKVLKFTYIGASYLGNFSPWEEIFNFSTIEEKRVIIV